MGQIGRCYTRAAGLLLLLYVLPACRSEFPVSLLDASPPPDRASLDTGPSPDAQADASPSVDSAVDSAVPDAQPDAQTVDAAPPTCGDGALDTGEGCDDGNVAPGDGCDAACAVESGWSCSGTPSECTPICGDGQILGDEQCDDGNLLSGDGCNDACVIDCSNGSTSDCNPTGQTKTGGAVFVDPDPPPGFVQCAGFRNTTADDVGPHWDANCLGAAYTLRVRYWDTGTATPTLLGDATLTPDSQATFTQQTFSAANHAGTQGFLETSGFTLLADDPQGGATPTTVFECTTGPASKHYGATDLYFGNQANTAFVLVSGFSAGDDAAALASDRNEIARYSLAYEVCDSNPPNPARDLAIALYFQN